MSSDYSTQESDNLAEGQPIAANTIGDNEWVKAAPPVDGFELRVEVAPPEASPPGEPPETESPPAPAEEPPLAIELPSTTLSLEALVESLLFVAEGPVPVARLAEALEVRPQQIEAALESLSALYAERGLSLQRIKDKVQLTTSATAAGHVQRFLGLAASAPLSKAALETLAIIAYQQPVTRPQIEAVRGVNSDSVIKNLLTKGLVEEMGRTEGPGRPVLYTTTPEFLQHFGLASLSDLPPLNLDGLKPAQPVEILKG